MTIGPLIPARQLTPPARETVVEQKEIPTREEVLGSKNTVTKEEALKREKSLFNQMIDKYFD